MASLSVATAIGWVVSPIVRTMVSQVQSYISNQYNWNSEVMSELKNLEAMLLEIQLAVGTAERRTVVDRNQVATFRQMKEAVCRAEDVLDEFDYMLLKEKVEYPRKVAYIASSSVSRIKRLVGIDKLRSKLQKVTESVTRVKACAKMFVKVMAVQGIQSVECLPTVSTGPLVHEDCIFGREKEVDELVSVLLNTCDVSSPDNGGSLVTEVHAVIGIGGIGKTTVAQLIYNDKRIADAFDLRMWVCVSRKFDKDVLIKVIIAQADDGKNHNMTNFNFSMLQKELRLRLFDKRFLLVLDDVWYDENFGEHINKEGWKQLMASMQTARAGSKILVTTRMELVAKMLDSRTSFFLQGLGQEASWSLFRKCVYGPYLNNVYPDLDKIGCQIIQRLNGLPLALRVIGGHLNGKYKAAEWNEVLHNNTFNPNDMLTILRLSYVGLPEHLQHCFAYCSLFPKGYHIDPSRLIHMWIAQGFVETEGGTNQALEDVGRSYFNDLLTRSFFQILTRGNQTFYIMHDMLNDLALHVSEGECLRVENESSMVEVPIYTRHLSVSTDNLRILENSELAKLRSLLVLRDCWFCSKVCMNRDIFDKLKSVRVLDISGYCLQSLPNSVCKLIHLRYLGISRTYYPLPEKICAYHLQALFLQYHSCYSLSYNGNSLGGKMQTVSRYFPLPENINKLINLVHVDVDKAYVLMLSSAHKLPMSVVCAGEFHVVKEEGSLVGLKDVNKLRGELTIKSLNRVKGREEASKGNLHLKEYITKLELQWESCQCASFETDFVMHNVSCQFASSLPSSLQDSEVLDVLKPHSDLEELTITGYPGAGSPSWLESIWLSRVRLISLHNCKRWEILPPLGDLPSLKTLELRRMEVLTNLGQEFFGSAGFPSLEVLCLQGLPNLECCLVDNCQLFRNLRQLFVSGCPELKVYPTYPLTLEHIAVVNSENIQIKALMRSVKLSRSFCYVVSSFFHVLHAHHLEFVESMEICVYHVEGMPRALFENLKCLKSFKISGIHQANTCSVISLFWDENGWTVLPSSLRRLKLERCWLQPSSFSKLLNNLSSLETLSLLVCETIEMPCPPVSLNSLKMLKCLSIYKCDWIKYFEGSEALVSLERLSISHCYDLEYVPDLNDMPSLQVLHLGHCFSSNAFVQHWLPHNIEGNGN